MIYRDNRIINLKYNHSYFKNMDKEDLLYLTENESPVVDGERVFYEDDWYYLKKVNNERLYNELIGKYILEKVGGTAVSYQVAIKNDNMKKIFIMSKNFRVKENSYLDRINRWGFFNELNALICSAYKDKIVCNTKFLDKVKDPDLVDDILKLSAVDIAMRQGDRYVRNITSEIDSSGKERLAPGYDFEDSFEVNGPAYFYMNPYIMVGYDERSINRLVKRYPKLKEYLNVAMQIDVKELRDHIESNYPVKMEEAAVKRYNRILTINKRIYKQS